jgi:hypothetical protein
MRNDIKNHLAIAQTIEPGNYQATETGTGVDLAGFDAAAVVITVGTATDTGFSFEVQESDASGSGYTAVATADLDGTEPTTAVAAAVTVLGYHGIKRYVRVVATDTGTGNADFGVAVVRGAGRVKP